MRSIRGKMLIWFGLTLTILLTLLGVATYMQTKSAVVPLTRELSQEVLAARSAEMGRLMQGYLNDVRTMSSRNVIRSGDFQAISRDLQERKGAINPDYEMLFYADAAGRYMTTTGATGDVSDRAYFQAIIHNDQDHFISKPIVSRASGENVFVVAAAVRNAQGRTAGLMAATVLLKKLSGIAGSITIAGKGFGWVADHNAMIIAHPDPAVRMHLNLLETSDLGYTGLEAVGRKVIQGQSGLHTYQRPDGSQLVTIFNPITNTPGWIIGVSLYEQELMDRADRLIRNNTLLMLTILLAVLLLVYWLSSRITRPVLNLKAGVEILSSGNLEHTLDIRTGDEIEALADSFNTMTASLKQHIHDLQRVTVEKERVEGELRVANKIQSSMLPRVFPPYPEIESLELYAIMEPAREVGGDFYDFFATDNQRLCFGIGDVSGKGIPAALFMVITMTILRNQMNQGHSLDQVFYRTNNVLCADNVESMFVTVFMGLLDPRTGELEYVCAGHNPPLISRQGGEFTYLDLPTSLVLGGMEDYPYQSSRTVMQPGDILFLYTDGLTEAMNPSNELFTDARMLKAMNRLKRSDVKTVIHGMQDEISRFVQDAPASDDVTMLALTLSPKS